MEDIKKLLAKVAPGKEVAEGTQYPTIELEPNEVRAVAKKLKEAGFDYLINLTGVDYIDALGTVYHISSSTNKTAVVVLKTKTADRENPVLYTVCDIWKSADLYEREVFDFYGIRFIDHPDMRRIFLRGDWKGFPFRKDYNEVNEMPTTNVNIDDLETLPSITFDKEGKIVEKTKQLFDNNEYVVNFGPQHPATHGVLHLRVSLDGEIVK